MQLWYDLVLRRATSRCATSRWLFSSQRCSAPFFKYGHEPPRARHDPPSATPIPMVATSSPAQHTSSITAFAFDTTVRRVQRKAAPLATPSRRASQPKPTQSAASKAKPQPQSQPQPPATHVPDTWAPLGQCRSSGAACAGNARHLRASQFASVQARGAAATIAAASVAAGVRLMHGVGEAGMPYLLPPASPVSSLLL